jgi:hypothetical protein
LCCGSASLDANPDPYPTFHFDDDPNPDLDPTPSFTDVRKYEKKYLTFIHAVPIYIIFIFVVCVKGVKIYNILDSVLKFSRKSIVYLYIKAEMYADMDPHCRCGFRSSKSN